MKSALELGLILSLVACLLAGCAQKPTQSAFEADNEILTYQKIDPDRTQIVVSRTGNIPVEQLCIAFEAQNPDVQIVYLDITGGNQYCAPLEQWLLSDDLPDIVITAGGFSNTELAMECFEDLSGHAILQNYETAALQRTAIGAGVYWLPGPSDISAMMYNRTLFDQYGWQVPASFDEFVRLCDQIRADTDGAVEAWNPNAKYSNEFLTSIEAFTYAELFGGLENRSWYNDLLEGKATFSEHMKPFFDVIQTLVDHDILKESHFSYSATTRGQEFAAGKIAMINNSLYDADSDLYDFAVMPYPTTLGDLGYLCHSYSCYVSLPKKAHTARQTDAINRFLAYFSSADGQRAYIDDSMKISNIKGVTLNQSNALSALQSAVDAGHLFNRLDFRSGSQASVSYDFIQPIIDMAAGRKTAEECLAALDAQMNAAPASAPEAPAEIVATATADLSMLETSFLIADAYREAAGADIGLIAHGAAYRGNLMRIYAGDIDANFVTVLKPRSFANDSTLVKLSMSGQQILDALNHPLGNDETPDCVYAYSGLTCEIAPWNALGEKYLSVKLADGSELDRARRYTVAAWDGTIAEEYVSETLERYAESWETMMNEKLRADAKISPASDGRVKLVWCSGANYLQILRAITAKNPAAPSA